MPYRKTENMMSLLGGALVGAAAMYLLDPETGKRRRERLAEHAGDYLGNAQDMLQSGWETASAKARDIGQTVTAKAKDYGSQLADIAQDYSQRLADQARNMGSNLGSNLSDTAEDARSRGWKWFNRARSRAQDYASSSAGDLGDNVTDYANRLWKRVRHVGNDVNSRVRDAAGNLLPERESSPLLPAAMTGIGCCALGVGLMYLMDPQRGRARRAWLGDQVSSLVRRTGRTFYRRGQDMANRAYGAAHETGSRLQSGGPVSSEQLLARVRSEMGRVVSHPRLVQVMTDANGTATLTGVILASESDRLVSTIERIPGVNLVVNRLQVANNQQELDRMAGAMRQSVPQI